MHKIFRMLIYFNKCAEFRDLDNFNEWVDVL